MKPIYHLTLAFLFICAHGNAQTQISFEVNEGVGVMQGTKGFMVVDSVQYFIEQGKLSTSISMFDGEELIPLHEITERPTNSNLSASRFDFSLSNSGMIHEGEIFYEIFHHYVYAINVVSGEIENIMDLKKFGAEYQGDFQVFDGEYFFKGTGNEGTGIYRYNPNADMLQFIEFSGQGTCYQMEDKVYRIQKTDDNANLRSYDINTGQQTIFYEVDHADVIVKRIKQKDDSKLLVMDKFLNKYYFVNEDHSWTHLTCLDGIILDDFLPLDNKVIYGVEGEFPKLDEFFVVDQASCEQLNNFESTEEFYIDYANFLDPSVFDNQFVIFSQNNGYYGNSVNIIYDVEQNEFSNLYVNASTLYMQQAIRSDREVFFVGDKVVKFYGSFPMLLKLNLDTKETQIVGDYDLFQMRDVVIGEDFAESEFQTYLDIDTLRALHEYNYKESSLDQTKEFDDVVNFGLRSVYESIWHEDKYFFASNTGLYVIENNKTEKLLSCDLSSGFLINDGILHTLVRKGDLFYKVQLNVDTHEFVEEIQAGMTILDYRRNVTENVIVNIPNVHNGVNTGYLDVEDGSFKSFFFGGEYMDVSRYSVSGNNLLLRWRFQDQYGWYVFNSETKQVIQTELPKDEWPTAHPDGKGGFFMSPWHLDDDPDFVHVDGEGKVRNIYPGWEYGVYYNGEKTTGELSSIAFEREDDFFIYSEKGGESYTHSFPHSLLYYQRFHWTQTEEISILQIPDEDLYYTYAFGFGIDHVDITPGGRTDELVNVIEYGDKMLLIFQDKELFKLSFEELNLDDFSLTVRQEYFGDPCIGQNFYFGRLYRANEKELMLSMNDGIHGFEPWFYNLETGDFALKKDINPGFDHGYPENGTYNSTHDLFYFKSNVGLFEEQMFTIEDLDTTHVFDVVEEIPSFEIYPNPSSGTIQLPEEIMEITIYDMRGKPVFYDGKTQAGLRKYCLDLPNGMYNLIAMNKDNEMRYARLVLIKP